MIIRDNQRFAGCTPAEVEWLTDGTPRSRQFGDIYYTPDGGDAESRYVFLEGNSLETRLALPATRQFRVGELGFGTGLNFLLTWALFRARAPAHARLHYWSCELHPMRRDDLERALASWPALSELAQALLAVYPLPVPGQHRCLLDQGRVTLDLCWEDADAALRDLAGGNGACMDAWYLDGFTPADNAGMWQAEHWRSMARASRKGATFSTFTAAGNVRRGLETAGFSVQRRPGFGRKRESLQGSLAVPQGPADQTVTPWDRPLKAGSTPARVLVLGGGLAGCMTAAAFARRGIPVALMERDHIAGRASGNAQGVIYTRLSHRHSTLTDLSLTSYLFALREYAGLFDSGRLQEGIDGALCGCLQMADTDARLQALGAALAALPELAAIVDRENAADLCGVPVREGGLWLPGSGWLDPRAVCAAVIGHADIEVIDGCGPVTLARDADQWLATPSRGEPRRADVAVVAAGLDSLSIHGLDWLPLRAVRGQTTTVPDSLLPGTPGAALCHTGYLAPPRDGEYCLGATFSPGDTDRTLRDMDHRSNLDALGAAVPGWYSALAAIDTATLTGRAELRCASPDYIPMAGRVPRVAEWRRQYAALAGNARQVIPLPGEYHEGLFVNVAHGSRGLTSTPLAAELVAGLACGDPAPVNRNLLRALAPARFIIRSIIRSGDHP